MYVIAPFSIRSFLSLMIFFKDVLFQEYADLDPAERFNHPWEIVYRKYRNKAQRHTNEISSHASKP